MIALVADDPLVMAFLAAWPAGGAAPAELGPARGALRYAGALADAVARFEASGG